MPKLPKGRDAGFVRMLDAIEREQKQARRSFEQASSGDPRFIPQVDNLVSSLIQIQTSARSMLRMLGVE